MADCIEKDDKPDFTIHPYPVKEYLFVSNPGLYEVRFALMNDSRALNTTD